jgi:hypothetical protein
MTPGDWLDWTIFLSNQMKRVLRGDPKHELIHCMLSKREISKLIYTCIYVYHRCIASVFAMASSSGTSPDGIVILRICMNSCAKKYRRRRFYRDYLLKPGMYEYICYIYIYIWSWIGSRVWTWILFKNVKQD